MPLDGSFSPTVVRARRVASRPSAVKTARISFTLTLRSASERLPTPTTRLNLISRSSRSKSYGTVTPTADSKKPRISRGSATLLARFLPIGSYRDPKTPQSASEPHRVGSSLCRCTKGSRGFVRRPHVKSRIYVNIVREIGGFV